VTDRSTRLLELFRAEARECLSALAAGALQIERGDALPEAVGALFRSAHTVKGGARMLGLDEVAGLADALEVSLAPHRRGSAPPTELGDRLLRGVEALRAAIWPEEALADPAVSTGSPEGAQRGDGAAAASGSRATTVRVRADRVAATVELVAEARRLASVAGEPDRTLVDLLGSAEEAALRLRLVPLGGLFDDLRLAVRDAAAADGKQAQLLVSGGDVEADATVVDAAAEAVLQLARNAVAHGLEPPAERERGGKPPVGTIDVVARASGGWLELTVSDDGRGVDDAAARDRAAALGLDPNLPVAELLFAPGLSTRRQADQLGGQGVGLDIVRDRTRAAGGDASVSWQAGRGTPFLVRLPVSALYERLVVAELDGALVGVPVDAVAEVTLATGTAGPGLAVDGRPEEVSVLTVPLGPLLAPSRLVRRGWIAPDGRVGLVLERAALAG
jgi:two-component system chemotaxis sensor kinase CheA